MIGDHFKDTITVTRGTVTEGTRKTTYEEVGDYAAHIQPVSGSFNGAEMGRAAREFRCFSTSELRIGDRIVDQNETKYEVFGVKCHRFRGKTHYESQLRGV